MTPHRIFVGTGMLFLLAALLPVGDAARADSPVCCSDVMFPERQYHRGYPGPYLVVDGIGRGRGVYADIQSAINDAPRLGGQVLIKPGTYGLSKPLSIRKPITIANFGGGAVRVRATGTCAYVDLHREGKVAINGIAFETLGQSGAGCIVVDRASEFQLASSDITVIGNGTTGSSACAPSAGYGTPASTPNCGFHGVVVNAGIARIQGNQIRRTGSAIAVRTPGVDTHHIMGNYLAGNATGVYVDGGARVLVENNGIFRNYAYGVNLENATGKVVDNDIEDNRTGLRIVPPYVYRSASASYSAGAGGAAIDYEDIARPSVLIERNLVTQYGKYRIHNPDPRNLLGEDAKPGEGDVNGYALEFGVESFAGGISDFPDKQGTPLSSVRIVDNCFFGPTQGLFDKDQWIPLIARTNAVGTSVGYNDALTPVFDKNTEIEHLDYDSVDRIDHENAIRSPTWHGKGLINWNAFHNWFARNKKEITCKFRYGGERPILSDGGKWPGGTAPRR